MRISSSEFLKTYFGNMAEIVYNTNLDKTTSKFSGRAISFVDLFLETNLGCTIVIIRHTRIHDILTRT